MTKIFDKIFMTKIFDEIFLTKILRRNMYDGNMFDEIFLTKIFVDQVLPTKILLIKFDD